MPFPECHIHGIILYETIWNWLISLSIILLWFIYSRQWIVYFLLLLSSIMSRDYFSLFIHSPFKRELDCFQYGANNNYAAINICAEAWIGDFEHYFTSMWDECNCEVVWAFFGIAFLWDWNENWPLPVLWPLLSFTNLLAYWVQHFHSIIFQDLKQLKWNSITSTSFVRSDAF